MFLLRVLRGLHVQASEDDESDDDDGDGPAGNDLCGLLNEFTTSAKAVVAGSQFESQPLEAEPEDANTAKPVKVEMVEDSPPPSSEGVGVAATVPGGCDGHGAETADGITTPLQNNAAETAEGDTAPPQNNASETAEGDTAPPVGVGKVTFMPAVSPSSIIPSFCWHLFDVYARDHP